MPCPRPRYNNAAAAMDWFQFGLACGLAGGK
jgi:hypothetical protein